MVHHRVTHEGMSSVKIQGPASAVAAACPLVTAVCAASARAEGGRPATSLTSVTRREKAWVGEGKGTRRVAGL